MFDGIHLGYVQARSDEDSVAALDLVLADEFLGLERLKLASKKPLMKFCGRLAFGSSSARKYLRM
jgi:hypothetical protein